MKAVVILGSRNPHGQTACAAGWLRRGLERGGAAVEAIFLPPLRIERCRQCDERGWGLCRQAGRCVVEDDFVAVSDQLAAADRAVVATPVYYSDMSESMRAFLDRLRRTTAHEHGRARVAGKPVVGVCVAGGSGGGAPACGVSLERYLTVCGFDVVDMISVRRQNLEAKSAALEQAGASLAGTASLRPKVAGKDRR